MSIINLNNALVTFITADTHILHPTGRGLVSVSISMHSSLLWSEMSEHKKEREKEREISRESTTETLRESLAKK